MVLFLDKDSRNLNRRLHYHRVEMDDVQRPTQVENNGAIGALADACAWLSKALKRGNVRTKKKRIHEKKRFYVLTINFMFAIIGISAL